MTPLTEIGKVKSIFRYPIKSLAAERLETASLTLHGLDGDRRFAFRRVSDRGDFPWLSAGRARRMILFTSVVSDSGPTHVRSPEGKVFDIADPELANEIAGQTSMELELMNIKHGVFDEASVSIVSVATITKIGSEVGRELDVRRFRPNLVLETTENRAFEEDSWVGKTISFGDGDKSASVAVTLRDLRCAMLNIDPDTAESDPEISRAVARLNDYFAGAYATVLRAGIIETGQTVYVS